MLDEAGQPVDGVSIQIRSMEASVRYSAEVRTVDGVWEVRDVPAGPVLAIEASRPGWTTRRRVGANQVGISNSIEIPFGEPSGRDSAQGYSYYMSGFPEVQRVELVGGSFDLENRYFLVDPKDVTLKLTFSESFDQATRERLGRAVRLWPASPDAGSASLDLSQFASVDEGDGLSTRERDFRPGSAFSASSRAIDAGPDGGAKVAWDDEGRTLAFAVDGSIGVPLYRTAFQVGLVSDGMAYTDAEGLALGTDRFGSRGTSVTAGGLIANVFWEDVVGPRTSSAAGTPGPNHLWNATHTSIFKFWVLPTGLGAN